MIVFISIAFFTLIERKVIRYTQNRKGPNKSRINGITQPIADAVKLINKEININYKSNFIIFIVSPTINITCSIIIWFIYPSIFSFKFMKIRIVYIICCISVNIIAVLTIRWSSNSNYSLLGIIRTVSQLVSYEINIIIIILLSINISEQINLEHITALTKRSPIRLIIRITLIMWIITRLAETNRTPFDFSEGESELISGFNVEFRGKSFIFLFLAEYSRILIIAIITTTLFFSAALPSPEFVLVYLALCFTFVWTRTSLPRFRYDKLIKINWQQILPTTITALMLSFSLKLYYTKKYK